MTGMSDAARRRMGTYSLGMKQRLGIAGALLGDPEVLMLDEPVNGLDPDGVRWIRTLLRSLADEGRTVFVSSHLMSEMQQTADRLVVIGRGRLIADELMESLLTGTGTVVRGPDAPAARRRVPRCPLDRRRRADHPRRSARAGRCHRPPAGPDAARARSHRDDAGGVLHEADGRQRGVRSRGHEHRMRRPAAATTAATAAAEWLKLRSVRSTWWFVGGATAVMLLGTGLEVDDGDLGSGCSRCRSRR